MDPTPRTPTPPAVEHLVTVATCTSRIDAQLKRGALEAAGLRAVVLTDDAGGAHPQLALLSHGAIRIAVPAHEADAAHDLLVELEAGLHALPSTGEHERLDPPVRVAGPVVLAGGLLLALLAYRAATMVWPGLG